MTEIQKALAAVRDNQPHRQSPLPWNGASDTVMDASGSAVCRATANDAACIAARVNSAPVLAAEVERLQDVIGCVGVEQIDGGWKIMINSAIGVGVTPRDAIEAAIDAEVDRQLAVVRAAVKKWPIVGPQSVDDWGSICGCANGYICKCGTAASNAARTEALRALGLEVGHG